MDVDSYAGMYRPSTGDLIDGRYELKESLGKGGMAHVWQAREISTDNEASEGRTTSAGREVAVKFLRHDSEALYALDPEERRPNSPSETPGSGARPHFWAHSTTRASRSCTAAERTRACPTSPCGW